MKADEGHLYPWDRVMTSRQSMMIEIQDPMCLEFLFIGSQHCLYVTYKEIHLIEMFF